jgi:dTDP-4-dehydrorhamnose 3,5-epimerase
MPFALQHKSDEGYPIAILEVRMLVPRRHCDARGYLLEADNRRALCDAGTDSDFAKNNRVVSVYDGTVRGSHFQLPPFAQAKLLRVVRGAAWCRVDTRPGSPSYGKHVSVVSADEGPSVFSRPDSHTVSARLAQHTEAV